MDALCPDEDLLGPASGLMAEHHALICDALQRTMNKPYGRLMLFLPPGAAKSTYCNAAISWDTSRPPPAHQQGDKRLIMVSYNDTIVKKQSRRAQQICKSPRFRAIWDEPVLMATEAAGEWSLDNGAEVMAAGITAGITGNRADGVLIDDPVKNREDSESEQIQNKTWDEYNDSIMTRLKPGAWVIIVQCMVGDTPVLMANGGTRCLRDVRPGDRVATYQDGTMSVSTVKNWANNGPDKVFKISMTSGKVVRANARHPFLAQIKGAPTWVRLKNLRRGQKLYSVSGGNGKVKPVNGKAAVSQSSAEAIVRHTTTRSGGLAAFARRLLHTTRLRALAPSSSTGTASHLLTTISCWLRRAGAAVCAGLVRKMQRTPRTGTPYCASITATTRGKFEGYCATTVTSLLAGGAHRKHSKPPQPTSDFTLDEIASIEPDGVEDVFDVQIEGTENFIANGIVSHNTRWHELDLSGRLLPVDYKGESGVIKCTDGRDWEVLNIPAKAERPDDPLGRKPGEYLWTEWFPPEHWQQYERADSREARRTWQSLYQQNPTPMGIGDFKREDFNWYEKGEEPQGMRLIGASDYAVTEKGGDFSEHGVWGLDGDNNLWGIDWWSGQTGTEESGLAFIDLITRYRGRLTRWYNEGGVIDKAMRPLLNRMMRENNTFVDLRSLPSMADKRAKVSAFGARCSAGGIWLPNVGWAHDLVEQLIALPGGRHDDKADVAGLIGRALDQFIDLPAPTEPEKRGIVPFSAEWLEYEEPVDNQVRYR